MENHENFKEKMNKMFERAKEKFDTSAEKIKSMAKPVSKTLKGIAAGTVIAAAGLTNVACTMPGLGGEPIQEDPVIENPIIEKDENSFESDKIFKTLNEPKIDNFGNLNTGIILYNHFNGCTNLDLNYNTLNQDIAGYLTKYNQFHTYFNEFENGLKGRPLAQKFFNGYLTTGREAINTAVKGIDGDNDFAPIMNTFTQLGMPMVEQMLDVYSQDDPQKAAYFFSIFKLLYNDARRFGAGDMFNKYKGLQQQYVDTIDETEDFYKSMHPNRNLNHSEMQTELAIFRSGANGFKPVLNNATTHDRALGWKMECILEIIEPEMNSEFTRFDGLKVISGILNTGSLSVMEEYAAEAGYYKDGERPQIIDPVQELYNYANEKYFSKISQQTQQQDDGRTM